MDSQTRFWFNEDLESRNYIVPGLIAVIMTMVGALLTALTVVRELERGSMEGLMATPLRKTELLLGKIGPYFLIGMFDMAVVMAMGKFLFQVPFRGNPLLFIGLSAIFLIATLGQGLLISVTSENQLQAFQMAMLTTFLPAFLLSGFVFSIYLMPLPLQIASYIVPARYLVTISKGIYLKGMGMEYLWPSALMLAGVRHFFRGPVHQEVCQEDQVRGTGWPRRVSADITALKPLLRKHDNATPSDAVCRDFYHHVGSY